MHTCISELVPSHVGRCVGLRWADRARLRVVDGWAPHHRVCLLSTDGRNVSFTMAVPKEWFTQCMCVVYSPRVLVWCGGGDSSVGSSLYRIVRNQMNPTHTHILKTIQSQQTKG